MKKSITIISTIVCVGVLAGCHFIGTQSTVDRDHTREKNTGDANRVQSDKNSHTQEGTQKTSTQEQNNGDGDKPDNVTISVPYIFGMGDIGCGVGTKFVSYQVPYTKGVLNAVYTALFDRSQDIASAYRNTVQSYAFLKYDSVTLSDGVAHVYLSGDMRGPDHCTLPELRAQIDHAAFQFDTVDMVTVYLNGEIYDWCEKDLSDGESGCPAKKQLWIDKKEK